MKRLVFAFALLLVAFCVVAQQPAQATRPDGSKTPLMVYGMPKNSAGCAPLAVISHGAGGNERGYVYLAQGLAKAGYYTLVTGHRDSGFDALRNDMRGVGLRGGLKKLVGDPTAYDSRMQDITAALRFASSSCKAPYKVLLGHSMGGETVMLEAGAKNRIGLASPPAGEDRFDAYVALSSEGPGMVFPPDAWSGIRKPMFVLTGTRDQALEGSPVDRQTPYTVLPGDGARGCHWLGVVDGATHMNFAGNGPGAAQVDTMILPVILRYLSGAEQGRCTLPPAVQGFELQAK